MLLRALIRRAQPFSGHFGAYRLFLCASISIYSHLLRDAQRRGIYFWPLGENTPKISRYVVVISLLALPICAIALQVKYLRITRRAPENIIKV